MAETGNSWSFNMGQNLQQANAGLKKCKKYKLLVEKETFRREFDQELIMSNVYAEFLTR